MDLQRRIISRQGEFMLFSLAPPRLSTSPERAQEIADVSVERLEPLDLDLLLGAVAIPERHTLKGDEHLGLVAKQEAGCSHFVVPRWIENDLRHADDTLDASLEHEATALELMSFCRCLGAPFGINVESVSIRRVEIEASVRLAERLRGNLSTASTGSAPDRTQAKPGRPIHRRSDLPGPGSISAIAEIASGTVPGALSSQWVAARGLRLR